MSATELLASRLYVEMGRQRLTRRQLAGLAGLDERTLRKVLSAKDTRLTTIEKIATALNIPIVALISDQAA